MDILKGNRVKVLAKRYEEKKAKPCHCKESSSSCPSSSSSSTTKCVKCEIHGKPCVQKVCVKKNCQDQAHCLNPNVKKAEKLFQLFVCGIQNGFNLKKLLDKLDDTFTFIVHDQTGSIPFAGCYDLNEFAATFGSPTGDFANSVSTFDASISNVYLSANFTRIMLFVNVIVTVQCAPNSRKTEVFTGPWFVFFSFDECGNVIKIDVYFETGPLVLFFENCSQ